MEQTTGRVMIVDAQTGFRNPAPFLDLPSSLSGTVGKRGLLGLAFHPDYATNGRLFVYFTRSTATSRSGPFYGRQATRTASRPGPATPS